MSEVLHYRAKVASLTRSRQPDDPELIDARRTLKSIRLEEHIRSVVETAPPPTQEQRDKLAALLRPTGTTQARDAA
jgi:hypothetical protein